MTSTRAMVSADHDEEVVASLRRSIRHSEAEYVVPYSVPTVLETVSDPADLVWSDSLAWVVPRIDDDGRLRITVATDVEAVTRHYEWVGRQGERDRYECNARLSTDWWVLWDAAWFGVSPISGERVESEAFSFHFTDGGGISSEMTSIRMQGPPNQTPAQRNELLRAYFDTVRRGSVAEVVDLFSRDAYAGSAVRDYFGGAKPDLAHLATLDELRAHYAGFFAAAGVEDVAVTNSYIRDWYLFAEARWHLRAANGDALRATTAEVFLLAPDGLISGRLGYGTPLVPR
ncbi:hypothetical protein [Pseudonocardia xishanensis]|uniref:SnoaL-like protein n=1 Tax=Pseudonocardia xishanensis TaxID=630995 RepID=A0ABP8RHA5_9PSEU